MSKPETSLTVQPQNELEIFQRLPPLPVFDEALDTYLVRASGFRCDSRESFDAGKALATDGTRLKSQIVEAFKPRKQAFDQAKQPTLDAEREILAKVDVAVKSIDALATSWFNEQRIIAQRKAEEERLAELRRREEARKAEVARMEAERAKAVEIAEAWESEPVDIPPVVVPEVVPPRPVKADLGFAYRKGARTKAQLKHRIVNPDAVAWEYRSADPVKIKAKIANYVNLVKDPDEEQVKKLAEDIGGVQLYWE